MSQCNPLSTRTEPCKCGGVKTIGALRCRDCRYSEPSQSKEPERVTKESLVASLDQSMSKDWLRKSLKVGI
jgi:hypothetical protein